MQRVPQMRETLESYEGLVDLYDLDQTVPLNQLFKSVNHYKQQGTSFFIFFFFFFFHVIFSQI
jgi:hypothetical protein